MSEKKNYYAKQDRYSNIPGYPIAYWVSDNFDSIFNTETAKHIKFQDMKLLKALYEYFEEDVYTPSTKYSELMHKHIEFSDELEKTFTPEQKELFERYWEIGSEMTAEENEQLFLFGYVIAKELDRETIL